MLYVLDRCQRTLSALQAPHECLENMNTLRELSSTNSIFSTLIGTPESEGKIKPSLVHGNLDTSTVFLNTEEDPDSVSYTIVSPAVFYGHCECKVYPSSLDGYVDSTTEALCPNT